MSADKPISPSQCRAARGMLEWSQGQLADETEKLFPGDGITRVPIATFEKGKTTPYAATLKKLRATFEAAGVVFIESNGQGPGVRMREPGE